MPKNVDPGFELRFDEKSSNQYPYGYWYAITSDGGYDAVGPTVEIALANLVKVLHAKVLED
jgi:hypothetical protein